MPLAGALALAAADSGYVPGEERAGGAATSHKTRNIGAFSQFSASLDFARQLDFKVGDGIFRKQWVSSPSSTKSSDGLGPLFNAPLWGIGLTRTVSGHSLLLHDGRARDLLEAVLWHGGEAQAARDRVVGLNAKQRAALIAFLESL
jgi:CxxC motif-containing protein (DUF1111 family)